MTIGPLTLSPVPKLQFFIPGTTTPNAGGLVFTYAAGTMTKQNTYSNENQTPNTNPIVLDANGECVCYLDSTLEYDFWYSPPTDTDPPTNPYWTVYDVGYGNMINGLAPLNSPTFTGTPKAPTPGTGDSSTDIATTQFVQTAIANSFTGTPTVPTAAPGTLTTQIATTAFVGAEIGKAWTMVVLSNTGTWTVPGPSGGTVNVKYRVWGAGGGGGGTTGGSNSYGGGGGGGGYSTGVAALTVGTVLTATFGTPGTAGSGSSAGGNAGSVTLTGGPTITCTGGAGGGAGTSTSSPSGGGGGTGSGGQLNVNGGNGFIGTVFSQGWGGGVFGGVQGEGAQFPGQGGESSTAGAGGLIVLEYLAQ